MRKFTNITPGLNACSFQRKDGNKIILWDRFNKHNTVSKSRHLHKFCDLKLAISVIKYDFSTLKAEQ